MTGLEDALREHFRDDRAEAIASVLRDGAAYSEGDAFAGAKLSNVPPAGYDRLSDRFQKAGLDAEFNGRMSVVSFVNDPDTGDEELDEAIRGLI